MSFGIPSALLFGLVLILASLSLFLTSKFKPELYQESDSIYVIIGIICGLLLLISLDLGAAMVFQQLLMIGSLITIMWQFIQVRAENKRLKGGGRSAGREASPRKGYTAQIDDEPEYAPAKRSNRRNKIDSIVVTTNAKIEKSFLVVDLRLESCPKKGLLIQPRAAVSPSQLAPKSAPSLVAKMTVGMKRTGIMLTNQFRSAAPFLMPI